MSSPQRKQQSSRKSFHSHERQRHRNSYPPQNRKTELCRDFAHGHCARGDSCSFAHGVEELKPRNLDIGNYKTEPCSMFKDNGNCKYGTRCHFLHDELEWVKMPEYTILFSPTEQMVRFIRKKPNTCRKGKGSRSPGSNHNQSDELRSFPIEHVPKQWLAQYADLPEAKEFEDRICLDDPQGEPGSPVEIIDDFDSDDDLSTCVSVNTSSVVSQNSSFYGMFSPTLVSSVTAQTAQSTVHPDSLLKMESVSQRDAATQIASEVQSPPLTAGKPPLVTVQIPPITLLGLPPSPVQTSGVTPAANQFVCANAVNYSVSYQKMKSPTGLAPQTQPGQQMQMQTMPHITSSIVYGTNGQSFLPVMTPQGTIQYVPVLTQNFTPSPFTPTSFQPQTPANVPASPGFPSPGFPSVSPVNSLPVFQLPATPLQSMVFTQSNPLLTTQFATSNSAPVMMAQSVNMMPQQTQPVLNSSKPTSPASVNENGFVGH